MTEPGVLTIILFFSMVLYVIFKRGIARSSLPLPPGPKKLPLIGNLFDLPTTSPWEVYHEWSKMFNTDIIHLSVAGTSIVVLDTYEAATELLEKRSSIYSGRVQLPMLNDLMGWNFDFAFMDYGDVWRDHRRLMNDFFNPSASKQFRAQELKAARRLLARLLNNTDDITWNLRQMAGEIIISVAYGLQAKPKDDPHIRIAEQGVHPILEVSVPGAYLVDTIPLLKYVPSWLPGAGFKRQARKWKELAQKMVNVPYEAMKSNIEEGIANPCFALSCLQKMTEGEDPIYNEYNIKCVAGTLFQGIVAGSDTTVSLMSWLIITFLELPEIMVKVQQEIDSVVQPGHLPDFGDENSMPYLTAVIKEILRWKVVGPLGLPHQLQAEDEYHGYRIPVGSLVIANVWHMLQDETVYPEPSKFIPERFMGKGSDIEAAERQLNVFWGFGRRICPGRHLAFSSVWIALVSILSVFDIVKAKDENGNVIEPVIECPPSLLLSPLPFKCEFRPRSKEAETLIRSVIDDL